MLGAVMYASKIIMEFAPNIHLLGVFTIAITIVYRKKALYPGIYDAMCHARLFIWHVIRTGTGHNIWL